MLIPSTPNSDFAHNFSERRPSSFLGSNLDSVDMDLDLLLSSANVGYLQLHDYNASNTAVHEYEATLYEDEDAGRLMLERTRPRQAMGPAVEDSSELESNVSVCGSDATEPTGSWPEQKKRRLSERISETYKAVKKRADSWSWRRDSVAQQPPALLLSARVDDSSSAVSPGSGEQSRDADDELSSEDEQLFLTLRPRRRSEARDYGEGGAAQTAPVVERQPERIEYQYPRAVPPQIVTYDEDDVHLWQEQQRVMRGDPQLRLTMMEREVRIAEREGAFTPAARERNFKRVQRLRSESSEQSQASVKYKARVARAQTKSDKRFQRWKEGREESPISKVFNRVWRRNGRGKESMMESDPASELLSSAEESSSSGSQSSVSAWSEDSVDRCGGDNVEAARFAGRAMQQAPMSW